MKTMKFILFLALGLTIQLHAQNEDSDSTQLRILANCMTGSFSSEEQAENDTNYYSINLEMHEIWEGDSDTIWLYVEQALSSKKEKPYRVRIYRLTYFDHMFESAVFRIPNEEIYYGEYQNDSLFADLNVDSLTVREGCAVFLSENPGNSYLGSTYKKECVSNMRGATYATSEVAVYIDRIESWDRGFNEEDEHVWGAENGPYIFKKKVQMMKISERRGVLPSKKAIKRQDK